MIPVIGPYFAASIQPDLHAASLLEDWLELLELTQNDLDLSYGKGGKWENWESPDLKVVLGSESDFIYSEKFRNKIWGSRSCCCCCCCC